MERNDKDYMQDEEEWQAYRRYEQGCQRAFDERYADMYDTSWQEY